MLMHKTENRVAVCNRVNNNAYRKQVIELIHCLVLGVHLAEYAVKMLCSAAYLALNIRLSKNIPESSHKTGYVLLAFLFFLVDT